MTAQMLVTEVYDMTDLVMAIRSVCLGAPVVSKTNPQDSTDTGVTTTGTGAGVMYIRPKFGATIDTYRLTVSTGGGDATRDAVTAGHTCSFTAAGRTIQSDSNADWTTIITGLAAGDFISVSGTANNDRNNKLYRVLSITNNLATNDLITLETTETITDESGISTAFRRYHGGAVFNVRRDPTGLNTDLGNMTAGRNAAFEDASDDLRLIVRTTTNWVAADTLEFDLVANALVSPGEQWTENEFNFPAPDNNHITLVESFLEGPGISTTEQINCNMQTNSNFGDDRYNIGFRGADGYEVSSDYDSQPNTSRQVFLAGTASPMQLWMVVSGDRFAGVLRAQAGVFEHFYCGYGDVLANTNQHPRPMIIGGSNIVTGQPTATNPEHRAYWDPDSDNASHDAATQSTSCYYRWVDGTWYSIANLNISRDGQSQAWWSLRQWELGLAGPNGNNTLGREDAFQGKWRPAPGNVYQLFPFQLVINFPQSAVVMELQGCYQITGFSVSSEDTITIGNDEYIVTNNVNSTGQEDFMALKLT